MRMTCPSAFLATIAVFLSSGCASLDAPPGPDAPDATVTYNCNQGSFTVRYDKGRNTATLLIGVQTIILDKAPSGGAAPYSAHGLSFWPEGRNNVLVNRNMSALYHNCSPVR